MFTGIIEEVGTIKSVVKGANSARITISAKKVLEDVSLGDSIATNGVCLTVTDYTNSSFTVDVMPETIMRSNLKHLNQGSPVNLERAMKAGGRFGGHMVSGHIDGTGIITGFKKDENSIWVNIKADEEILRYIVQKGSVAVDGISLTVHGVNDDSFSLSIIPHTKDETTLINKNKGDEVNIECDILGKYIERFLQKSVEQNKKKDIDMGFLREHGYI